MKGSNTKLTITPNIGYGFSINTSKKKGKNQPK